jgi:hypothetical protein
MMECEQPTPIPTQLIKELVPLQESNTSDVLGVLEVHLTNMQQCGVCYARYQSLLEAIDARAED